MRVWSVCHTLVLFVVFAAGSLACGDDEVEFSRDIRPLLSDRCFKCHGPDAQARQANLRFDVVDDKEGPLQARDEGPAIKPGNLQESLLWYRLTTTAPDEIMPPADSKKEPLTAQQKELFKKWILQGARFDGHWSFVRPHAQEPPPTKNPNWSEQRIDQFVLARLERAGLAPQPAADQRSLIRRVSLDLTGLPPSVEEIRAFLADDSDEAYEKLVARLLSKPQYGEHMAKYWLDLVRFADTNGIHHDHYRELTPYRDWVIRAFNDNLPFDEFIQYQIAGDLYKQPSLDQQIASGFNRLHLVIDRGTALPQESFHRNVVDRVTAFGTAFLGLTVGCAQCHDHKYDPLTQRDFYQLYAFFNNIDAEPETPGSAAHPPFLRVPSDHQAKQLDFLELKIKVKQIEIDELQLLIKKFEADEATKDKAADLKQQLADAEKSLKAIGDERVAVEKSILTTLVMKERSEVRPTHIMIRGAYDRPGEEVERGTPAFLPPLTSEGNVKTRLDLAKWVTAPENPLAARVAVNRLWQQFFGVGLVKTSEDFGAQGDWPSHPRLLDDLAVRFMADKWNVKGLVTTIVLSQTYRQSSRAAPEIYRLDPQNRLLARGSRFRLDAEVIRDQILAVSGLLNREMYGKSVKPPQPPNLWKSVSMKSSNTYSFTADDGEKIYRRSLYSFWKRAMPPPQMTIFDAPTRESCVARRERTNTPLQALVLMNEEQYFHAAKHFARKLLETSELKNDEQRIQYAYEAVTSHLPDDKELGILRTGLASLQADYEQDLKLAQQLAAGENPNSAAEAVEIAAYTMLINSLFNLDITKTRE